jgi:shikimate dehydrogenase
MTVSGATRVAAVIGHPVGHSLSPAIHNAAFRAGGLDWVYVALPVEPGEAAAALAGMRALGIAGLSVTMPHKSDVYAAVDVVAPEAEALESVNTVVVDAEGLLVGHSTDGGGFVDSLRADAETDPAGRRIAVLGAGGAARSVIDALGRAGAKEIIVINRTASTAAHAARLAGAAGRVGTPDDVRGVDIVVNATSVGMGSDVLALEPELLRPGVLVADLVYHPIDTVLLRAARERGCRTLDGLGMLIHQAARQQVLWTGRQPDVAAMRAAAEAVLAAA